MVYWKTKSSLARAGSSRACGRGCQFPNGVDIEDECSACALIAPAPPAPEVPRASTSRQRTSASSSARNVASMLRSVSTIDRASCAPSQAFPSTVASTKSGPGARARSLGARSPHAPPSRARGAPRAGASAARRSGPPCAGLCRRARRRRSGRPAVVVDDELLAREAVVAEGAAAGEVAGAVQAERFGRPGRGETGEGRIEGRELGLEAGRTRAWRGS